MSYYSKIRDLKINSILNNTEFKVDENRLSEYKDTLKFLYKEFPKNTIITGSLSLYLYGLIDRRPKDIDILIDESVKMKWAPYVSYGYGKNINNNCFKNRLGEKYFKVGFFPFRKKYTIDFFIKNDEKYKSFDFNGAQINISFPIDVISKKVEFLNILIEKNLYFPVNVELKHRDDIDKAFSRLAI